MSTVIEALFTAKETISDAFDQISSSAEIVESNVSDIDTQLQELGGSGQLAQNSMDELRNANAQISQSLESVESNMRDVNLTLGKLDAGLITAEEANNQLRTSLRDLIGASEASEQSIDSFESTVNDLAESGMITGRAADSLNESLSSLRNSSLVSSQGISTLANQLSEANISSRGAKGAAESYADALNQLSGSALASVVPQKAVSSAVDETSDEMDEASRSAIGLVGNLGLLNSVASSTALEFGSLSVNIGPFNLALQNFLTQVPAILTGMSTMLAIATSLIAAFATLGLVTGGLVVGGALAFFEDFSSQFEDSAQAAEALMGALRDLFMSAMEPIMTEANMNLFINSVDAAANVVNRFAQFVNQMRDDVLSFLSTIDGDMDDFFEAMHDTFVLLQPVLRGFIEFFISDVPRIIKRFAVLTENISGDVGLIISSIGALIDELLDFASVIIGVLAPVIFVLTAAIETLFSIFNFFPNIVKTTVVALAVMGFIVSALTLKFISMAASLSTLHTQMVAQIGTSSVLAATYNALSANLARYLSGQISLRMALAATNLTLMKGISAWAASTAAKLLNLSTTNALIVAMGRQLAAISALTAGNIGLATAAKLTAANIKFFTLSMWASAKAAIVAAAGSIHAAFGFGLVAIKSTLAAGGVWLLNSALTYLASPIWLTVAAIAALIAGIVAIAQAVTQNDIFAPLIDGANNVINKLKEMLGFMDVIPGIGGGGDILGPENARDIQTNPNVDLSFEDSVENNVEVQADPEDKAQLSRITKDALEEANSFDRRQQGGQ